MEAIKLKRIVIKEELYAITNDTIESIILGHLTCNKKDIEDGTVDVDKELLNNIE